VTAGHSSLPEVQRLLRVLAAGRRAAEIGTCFGDGAAAIAETAASVVTVEVDEERFATAQARLRGVENVELVHGDWREVLPERAPFELVFWDGGFWKQEPTRDGPAVVDLLAPGGLLVADDFTPGFAGPDRARAFLFEHPSLVAAEVSASPTMAVIVAALVPPK
jgi:predicted O-methyltransferase YrrM